MGFSNGGTISSDLADVILRVVAAAAIRRSGSAPRILVNDNATGTLQSLSEQPYTSTNIGTPLATTSFAGYAEAGTEDHADAAHQRSGIICSLNMRWP